MRQASLRIARTLLLPLIAAAGWICHGTAAAGGSCPALTPPRVEPASGPDQPVLPCFQQIAGDAFLGPAVPVTRLEQLGDLAGKIQEQIEDLRGRRFKEAVRVEELDSGELARRAQERFERIFSAREIHVLESVAKLLGMLDGGEDLQAWFDSITTEIPKGFYDVSDDVFYVADDLEPESASLLMASELARAIEDQHHRVDEDGEHFQGNRDAWLAHQAVVQGALSTLMRLWLDRHVPDFGLMSLAHLYQQDAKAFGSAPPLVWRPLFALRMRGMSFLRRTHMVELEPGDVRMEDIDRAFRDGPRSTEQILHPVKYWRRRRWDEPRLFRLAPVELPEAWSLEEENTLGELYLGILTLTPEERGVFTDSSIVDLLSERYTTDASDGWGGDRYALIQGEDGGKLVKLTTSWDTPSDAREFFDAMLSLEDVVEGSKREWYGRLGNLSDFDVTYDGFDRVTLTSWVGIDRDSALALSGRLVFEEVDSE